MDQREKPGAQLRPCNHDSRKNWVALNRSDDNEDSKMQRDWWSVLEIESKGLADGLAVETDGHYNFV